MRILISIFLIALIFSCNNRESDNNRLIDLAAKAINDSVNHGNFFYNDTIRILDSITKNKYIDFLPLKRLNLFSDKDFELMDSQNKVAITYNFQSLTRNGYKLIRTDELKSFLDNKHHKGFYVISRPLYSLDYNKALLNVDFVCYDCGRGYILIMDKVNNKWVLKMILNTWIN